MTAIKRSEVPEYLHQSELYLSLNKDENDDEISVPSNCMKMDVELNNVDDLEHLLLTMRFWITNTFPEKAIAFMSLGLSAGVMLRRHQQEYPELHLLVEDLCTCEPEHQCRSACKYGRLDFLDYFVRHGRPLSLDSLETAANHGQLECLKYVYDKLECEKVERAEWKGVNVEQAARAGHLECLQYLVERGLPRSEELWTSAAEGNQVSTLKYIIAPYQDYFCVMGMSLVYGPVVRCSSIDCVEYLLDTFPTLIGYENIARAACRAGNTDMIKYAIDHGAIPIAKVVTLAARAGSMKCLLYLQDEWQADCWMPSTVTAAMHSERWELLIELLQQKCPCAKEYVGTYLDEMLKLEGTIERTTDPDTRICLSRIVDLLKQARILVTQI